MKYALPEHGSCFVCGSENPHSIGLKWFRDEEGIISAEMSYTLAHQGPPGHAHGGSTAATLDEAMGAAVWRAGHSVVAARLEIDYRKPVPLGQVMTIEARVSEVHARKIIATGEICLADGSVAVSGRGIYVPAPHLFENVHFGS